jgi:hypothetical protein
VTKRESGEQRRSVSGILETAEIYWLGEALITIASHTIAKHYKRLSIPKQALIVLFVSDFIRFRECVPMIRADRDQ